jgi:hypothetical protein
MRDLIQLVLVGNTGIQGCLRTILRGNKYVGSELAGLRSCITDMIGSVLTISVCEEPFLFGNAFGQIWTIHLTHITTWEAFGAVLLIRFRDMPGYGRVRRKEYGLMEEVTGREIVRSGDIRRDILPGQKIVQDIFFADVGEQADPKQQERCPYCKSGRTTSCNAVSRRW